MNLNNTVLNVKCHQNNISLWLNIKHLSWVFDTNYGETLTLLFDNNFAISFFKKWGIVHKIQNQLQVILQNKNVISGKMCAKLILPTFQCISLLSLLFCLIYYCLLFNALVHWASCFDYYYLLFNALVCWASCFDYYYLLFITLVCWASCFAL